MHHESGMLSHGDRVPIFSEPVAEFLNPSVPEDRQRMSQWTRCSVGRHPTLTYQPWVLVDGKAFCLKHASAIADAWHSAFKKSEAVREYEYQQALIKEDHELFKARREREMRERAARQPGFVYYIRIGEHIKIGYATDVNKRMRAYPPSAELLAVHPGTLQMEKELHAQFNAYLDRGREWFNEGKSLAAHIAQVRKQFGDPGMFAHRYTKRNRTA